MYLCFPLIILIAHIYLCMSLIRSVNRALLPLRSIRTMSSNSMLINILFEDDHMIAVNKPANILSVPGKGSRNMLYEAKDTYSLGDEDMRKEPNFVPRFEKWAESLKIAAIKVNSEGSSEEKDVMSKICGYKGCIPRKRQLFLTFLTRNPMKVENAQLREKIWKIVSEIDFARSRSEYNTSLSTYEPCIADILEELFGKRIFQVHRLDQETSGILMFAKDEISCAALTKQFRDKLIQKTYIAKVKGKVALQEHMVDVPIRPDLTNRPYQVGVSDSLTALNKYIIMIFFNNYNF